MRIEETFRRLKKEGKKAFIPYLTAGDPDLDATACFVKVLAQSGADVIELGVPFSDPVADGPTNQRSASRALAAGATLERIMETIAQLRDGGLAAPILLFTYLNPVLRFGMERFAERAAKSGADGVLMVDLPAEESGLFLPAVREAGLCPIFLASPTTSPERLSRVGALASGFLYYVSRRAVTGAQAAVPASLAEELAIVRRHVSVPIAVGFGISTPDQAREVAQLADGVVVGSALVEKIEQSSTVERACTELQAFCRELVREVKNA
jgi:tryptophan synthase alpha chain